MCYDTTFLVHAVQLPLTPTLDSLPLCPSDTLFLNNLVITNPGTYYDTLRATVGCDTAATYVVYGVDNPVKTAAFALCPFDSVLVDGVWYPASDTSFSYNLPAATGCDTLAEITIQVLPSPEITKNIAFCPGDTVYVDNLPYTEPDTLYNIIIPDAAGGCDTIATFVIERLPQDTSSENLTVCAGDSILVNGQWFTSDTAFSYLVPQTSLCPSVVLTAIKRLPLPEVTRTVEFCPGDTVYIQGAPYSQPDTLEIRLPSAANDCDTLATYVLQYLQPDPPAQVSIDCPADITVNADPGVGGAVVSFAEPLYGSNCPCPGLLLEQISGPNSGELFPVGATEVCFRADDNCGSSAPCCFNVTVEETDACDVKTNVCMKFELLSITRNVTGDKTYRIRVTNYCNNEMIHTAIQLPNGVNALRPANSTYYTGPSGKAYLVRNPNASPQHSIRFKTAGATGIRNGESEVFQYTLPEQSSPAYMNVTAKLWPNQTFAGHLNTFFCPVTLEPNPWNDKPAYRSAVAPDAAAAHRVSVLPNPNDGAFVLMWSGFQGETLHLRVLNAQGGLVLTEKLSSEEGARELNLPAGSPAGPYAIQVFDEQGNRSVQLFVKY